ncbi:MAG: DEAD/DEAH box helicase, partial [Proteobacteria bacterium]|nr:DEAD/DEAH box helicase [Pseudomonadota bacterium]
VDEEFALESAKGDVFLLGNHSWQISGLKGDTLLVKDLNGAPPSIPFWKGEAGGRSFELSSELSRLREEADALLSSQNLPECLGSTPKTDQADWVRFRKPLLEFIQNTFLVAPQTALQAADFLAAQKIALGTLPTQKNVVYERFFDDTGGMQLIVHAPFGSRINRAWGLSFRKRFCRGFDFELQASATDNGILLSVGPNQSFPLESMFKMLNPQNGRSILIQALLDVPMFEIRWRWNVTRSLAVLKMKAGKRVPPHLQRYQSNDLLTAVFPQQTQCFEHRTGDLEIPDHPLVKQTLEDCLQEAMDCVRFEQVLGDMSVGNIKTLGRDTREPSPFCYELIHANPYAFLDDAPLEERRVRALTTRHRLEPQVFKDLTALDPGALSKVISEAWPLIRDADELYDAIKQLLVWPITVQGTNEFHNFLQILQKQRRIKTFEIEHVVFSYVPEQEPWVKALYPESFGPNTSDMNQQQEALLRLLRGHLECLGPQTAEILQQRIKLRLAEIVAGLQGLESQGVLVSGQFTAGETAREWCERRLLQRMHRLTIEGLREQIRPVSIAAFLRFLSAHQRVQTNCRLQSQDSLLELVEQLQGLELPASVWENEILRSRVQGYLPRELDNLCLSGQLVWGRVTVQPPKGEATNRTRLLGRNTPLSFITRKGLAWIIPNERPIFTERLSAASRDLWQKLELRGALFFDELASLSKLLSSQLEDALSELMSMGHIAADSFALVRPLVNPDRRARTQSQQQHNPRHIRYAVDFRSGGRFSAFASNRLTLSYEEILEQWAWQLLKRYGVVFREVLQKESLAPAWSDLARVYRSLEARGLIRGGRFIEKVGGEQFALKETIDQLRACREAGDEKDILILAAADPLNWMGILTDDPKIAAQARHRVAMCAGRYLAYREGRDCHFIDQSLPLEMRVRIERALRLNGLYRQQDPFLKDGESEFKQSPLSKHEKSETKVNLRNWRHMLGAEQR